MSNKNNNWDPSDAPSSDLEATLAIATIFAGLAATAAFAILPAFSQTSVTMGSTTSAKVEWQQRQQQFQDIIDENEKLIPSQNKKNKDIAND